MIFLIFIVLLFNVSILFQYIDQNHVHRRPKFIIFQPQNFAITINNRSQRFRFFFFVVRNNDYIFFASNITTIEKKWDRLRLNEYPSSDNIWRARRHPMNTHLFHGYLQLLFLCVNICIFFSTFGSCIFTYFFYFFHSIQTIFVPSFAISE